MSNQAIVWLGTKWINEDQIFPVYMEDNAGVAKTGLVNTDVTVQWARANSVALVTFVPTALQWKEMGAGLYLLFIPFSATVVTVEGAFELYVKTVAAGNKESRGFAQIEKRNETRVWDEPIASHIAAGSMGLAQKAASEHFEVFVNPSYDDVTDTITFVIWLQKNGQTILTPTSCRVIVKQESTTLILDIVNSSPNADGYFKIQSSPIVLNADKTFEVVGRVIFGGITYESGNAMTTFN
jgi:hypothetical protein